MSENGLVGQSVEDVITAIVDRGDDRDPETVREALDPVTDDGVVTREAIEATVSDTAKVVSTAETRAELASIAHEDATAAAAPVDDLDIVVARLEEYASRLEGVESRIVGLRDDLRTPVEHLDDPNAVYELAVDLRQVAATAQEVVRTAEDLSTDLDAFESWLDSPDCRYDEFAADIDLVEESLAELSSVATALSAESDAPAADWADATMRTRVIELLVADLRAELADLRAWADREDAPFRAALDEQVENLEQRAEELTDTLAEHAEPAWRDQFEDDLAAFQRELNGFEPPVDWERVQATLEQRREQTFASR
jgi:chromosome segregation ATPase